MFFLRRPSRETIAALIDAQRAQPFTYPEVGASRDRAPAGYPLNHHRGRLGHGRQAYAAARAALERWAMYGVSWTELHPPDPPVAAGGTVGVLVRHFAFWSLNCARIAYVLEEDGPPERYGFAIGTLPVHAERGEERFTVEYHPADGSVWFEIYTFAAAGHWTVRLTQPLMRWVQRRFGREAVAAMQTAARGA